MRAPPGLTWLLGTALALAPLGARALAAKAPPCSGGTFLVEAAASPLVPGGATPDLVSVGDDGATSIASGCPLVPGKLAARRGGTKLRARWTAKSGLCSGLPKKASLSARFDASCDALAGTFASKGVKRTFTAARAAVVLDGGVPAWVHGERLDVARGTGADMLAADPTWADTFAALGTSADAVAVAVSTPPSDATLDVRTLAWTAPGAGFAQRLADFVAGVAAHPGAGYAAEAQTVGGRSAWKITAPADPTLDPTWYYASGDTLFLVASGDDALAADVLAALPPSAAAPLSGRVPRGDPPLPGSTTPLVARLLQPVAQPVCVAEPYGSRVRIDLAVLDPFYQMPVLATVAPIQMALGATDPPVAAGGSASFRYRANTFGAQEHLLFQVVAAAGGQGQAFVDFPVQHCLNGTWQDDVRVLRVGQHLDQVTAEIASGALCDEEGGVAFTATLGPYDEHFSGSDLKVCNPDVCVQAGVLEKSAVSDYTASVSPDGLSVTFDWDRVLFDLSYDDHGTLVGCTPNGNTEPRSFTIERIAFGPDVP